ncbi:50S ribosomal protein L10 [Candidatus Woesearchaeota archaeon]|nr:50S ribosomal protein L10 [Candidatus Woesearchaeota archaeon]
MKTKAASYKKELVKKLVKLIVDAPIIGAVNMENLPASAVQTMRAKLRGKAEIFMAKRRLMKLAFEEAEKSKKGINTLVERLDGMPALLFTKENPFAIYKIIKKSKSPAVAKAGQKAPKDIMVKAGTTPFMPGPIIGELGQIGIKTGVENGKVAIKEDSVVVKEGEVIQANVASVLARLDIKPMEIGLDITGIYEAGTIYDRKVLDVDEDRFMADLQQAASWARNLAMDIGHLTKELMPELVAKAFRDSKALALEANFMADAVTAELLAKAENQMQSLKQTANIPDAPKEEAPKEEPKPETPKEEPKKEEAPKEQKPEAQEKTEERSEEKKEEPKADKPEEKKETKEQS